MGAGRKGGEKEEKRKNKGWQNCQEFCQLIDTVIVISYNKVQIKDLKRFT